MNTAEDGRNIEITLRERPSEYAVLVGKDDSYEVIIHEASYEIDVKCAQGTSEEIKEIENEQQSADKGNDDIS